MPVLIGLMPSLSLEETQGLAGTGDILMFRSKENGYALLTVTGGSTEALVCPLRGRMDRGGRYQELRCAAHLAIVVRPGTA